MKTLKTFSIGSIVDAKQISKAKWEELHDEAYARELIVDTDIRVIRQRCVTLITLDNGTVLIATIVGRRKTADYFISA